MAFLTPIRVVQGISPRGFLGRMRAYGPDRISCTPHTFFRLSQGQRKVHTCEALKERLLGSPPVFAGIQENGCTAAFYKLEGNSFMRVILSLQPKEAQVVTFYIVTGVPQV